MPDKELQRRIAELEDELENIKKENHQLILERDRNRILFDHAPLGITYYDDRGVVLDCNNTLAKSLGTTKEKVRGVDMPARFENQKQKEALQKSLKGKKGIFEGVYTSVTGGKTSHLKTTYFPIIADYGKLMGGIGITEDISELVKNQNALELFERYSSLGLFIADKKGNIVYSNEVYTKLTGLSLDEAKQGMWKDLIHPEDRADFFQARQEASAKREHFEREFRLQMPNGDIRWILARIHFLHEVEHNEVSHYGTLSDITDAKRREEELKKSERNLKIALGLAKMGMWVFDAATGEFEWSKELFELCGIEPQELNMGLFETIIHPEDFESCIGEYGLALKESRDIETKFRIIRPDGQIRHMIAKGRSIFGSDHRVEKIIGFNIDVTEEVEREATLEEVQRNLNEALSFACMGTWFLNADDKQMHWTEAQYKLVKRKPQPATPEFVRSTIHPDDVDKSMEYFSEAFRSEKKFTQQFRILLPNDEIRYIENFGKPIYDEKGNFTKYVGYSKDITDQKLANEDLLIFNEILDHMRGGVALVAQSSQTIVFTNRRFNELFGYPAQKLLSRPILTLLPKTNKNRSESTPLFIEAIKANRDWSGRIQCAKKNGMIFWGHCSVSSYDHYKHGRLSILVVEDVDLEFSLEERLRQTTKMEAIGNLAGGIAHDFNNILQNLLLTTELLKTKVPKKISEGKEIQRLYKGIHRAKEMIRQIRSFTLKESRDFTIFHLNQFILESLPLIQTSLQSKIKIQTEFESKNDLFQGNESQLFQLLLNILTNAAQAMKGREGIIRISVRDRRINKTNSIKLDLPQGDYICISIKDKGVGIPPEQLDRVFEPFYTTKSVNQNSGLGLSIVHGIVNAHNGKVQIESEEGIGTKVEIILPLTKDNAKSEKQLPTSKQANSGSGKILLVDDESGILEAGKGVLERYGFQVETFEEAQSALSRFMSDPSFDILITDLSMPKMNGVELLEKIREKDLHFPAILITGNNERLNPSSKEGLFDEILHKPFSGKELCEAVSNVINRNSNPNEIQHESKEEP